MSPKRGSRLVGFGWAEHLDWAPIGIFHDGPDPPRVRLGLLVYGSTRRANSLNYRLDRIDRKAGERAAGRAPWRRRSLCSRREDREVSSPDIAGVVERDVFAVVLVDSKIETEQSVEGHRPFEVPSEQDQGSDARLHVPEDTGHRCQTETT